jgi:rhamnose utilization protein RhaD (predicted bifunctional aldolase and dehydrogenase)
MDDRLRQLVDLSRQLADPSLDLVLLGEGNTSADCEDGSFWVKASGCRLSTIDECGFSRVRAKQVLDLLGRKSLDDRGVAEGLKSALLDPAMRRPLRSYAGRDRVPPASRPLQCEAGRDGGLPARPPSVETFLHALCIVEGGVKWIGHSHPVSVMSILCSREGARPFTRHIYPDEIVVCGLEPLVVPYRDPGLPLARAVRDGLKRHLDAFGRPPQMILMVNHGLVALGQKPADVMNITLTADKWARTLLGTYALGGPRYLTEQQARRIETRPDEAYRRKQISSKA